MLHNIKVGNWVVNAWHLNCDGLHPSEIGVEKGDVGFKLANKIYRWGKKGYEGVVITVSSDCRENLKNSMIVPELVSSFCKKEKIYYWAAEKFQSHASIDDDFAYHDGDLKIYEDDTDFNVEFDFFVKSMGDVDKIIDFIKSNEFRFMGSLKC